MVRCRVAVLLLLIFNTTAEDATQVAEEKIGNTKPPDKIILQKSEPYSQISGTFVDTLTTWLKNSLHENKNSEDLEASATQHVGPQYLPPANSRGYARSCYECNREPWIPIAGRSLHFPPPSSHSNSLEDNNKPHFKEKHSHGYKQLSFYRPLIDHYGAPQGAFDFPPIGEVVDFMLPPPYKSGSIISGIENLHASPSPSYGSPPWPTFRPLKPPYSNSIAGDGRDIFTLGPPPRPKALPTSYGPPSVDISPPPLVRYGAPQSSYGPPPISNSYGPPPITSRVPVNHYGGDVPTTYLRPVSQDFQPPLPGGGIHTIPLENNLPPAIPSDSYGRPVTPSASAPHTDNYYGASGDSENNGNHAASVTSQNHFFNIKEYNSEIKGGLSQKGLTDVQVVPSVRIADYTASVEHPINLIQSPILDLNIKDQQSINEHINKNFDSYLTQNTDHNSGDKLSENPIVVDDTYTSASNINTTYSAADNNSSTVKRHNNKFLSSKTFDSSEDKAKDADLTENLIKKLILEHNIIEDPKTQIVGIQKTIINPTKARANLNVVQPSVDYSSWAPTYQSTISTIMTPPKPHLSTWLTPINDSFTNSKQSKEFQIIIPYLKAPVINNNKGVQHSSSTAIFNRDYTTLAPVFVPPPMTTQPTDLWTQLVADIHTGGPHGFARSPSTTEVYNIKDFLSKQQNAIHNNLPYDIVSLQKNIDDWTHQAYSNRYDLGLKLTTKLAHVKNIPGDYFTTTPSGDLTTATDHAASSSEKKEFNDVHIEDNLIIHGDTSSTTTTTTKLIQNNTIASVRYVVRQPKPSWQEDKVTFSNSTHEKVYVVTPQSYAQLQTSTPATAFSMAPRIQNGKVNNVATMTRISVHVEAPRDEGSGRGLKPVKVIYSEWPHLINNLETTTTQKPTTRHTLFGLIDLAPYTDPPNSAVETIGGHSKVSSVATAPINKQTSTTPMPSTKLSGTVKISPVT